MPLVFHLANSQVSVLVCICKLKGLNNYYLSLGRVRAYSSAIVCCFYVVSVQRGHPIPLGGWDRLCYFLWPPWAFNIIILFSYVTLVVFFFPLWFLAYNSIR